MFTIPLLGSAEISIHLRLDEVDSRLVLTARQHLQLIAKFVYAIFCPKFVSLLPQFEAKYALFHS